MFGALFGSWVFCGFIQILKISLVTEFQSVTDCTLVLLFVREFNRQPVGTIDHIRLQVIYQTPEAVLNQISKHQAESWKNDA